MIILFFLPNFSGNLTTIEAVQVYVFNGNDFKAPSGLLAQLLIVNGQAPLTTTLTPATVRGQQSVTPTTTSAVVLTRLIITNSSLIPCESLVNSTIKTLLDNQGSSLPGSVKMMSYTFESKAFFILCGLVLFYISSVLVR